MHCHHQGALVHHRAVRVACLLCSCQVNWHAKTVQVSAPFGGPWPPGPIHRLPLYERTSVEGTYLAFSTSGVGFIPPTGHNKKLHRDDLDEIINNISVIMAKFYMAKFCIAGIDTVDKTTGDFQAEAAAVSSKALIDLHDQYPTPCYDQCFRHLLATLSSLVGVRLMDSATFEGLRDQVLKPYLTMANEARTA